MAIGGSGPGARPGRVRSPAQRLPLAAARSQAPTSAMTPVTAPGSPTGAAVPLATTVEPSRSCHENRVPLEPIVSTRRGVSL